MGFPSGVLQDVSSAWSCLRRRADAVPERTLTVEAGARSMVLGMSLTASTHSVFFHGSTLVPGWRNGRGLDVALIKHGQSLSD